MAGEKTETLQGSIDLMVLKTLESLGPFYGYGIARRIEQIRKEIPQVNQDTICAPLVGLIERDWSSGTPADRTAAEKPKSIPSGNPDADSSAWNGERNSAAIGHLLGIAERG